MEKRAISNSGIPSPDKKQLPIIPLGNEPYHRKKNPTVSSGDYLMTVTSNIQQLKSHQKLLSKYKESTPSYLDVA